MDEQIKKKVIDMCNGILLRLKTEGGPVFCNNLDASKEHSDRWNKSGAGRQVLHDFIYMWILKSQINRREQNVLLRDQMMRDPEDSD